MNIKQNGSSTSSYSSSSGNSSSRSGGFSSNSNGDKFFRLGADLSIDIFVNDKKIYGLDNTPISWGIGLRSRFGRNGQLINVIAGARYVGGKNHSGLMVPLLLNANIIRSDGFAGYLGGGYEFGFLQNYKSSWVLQAGISMSHTDFGLYFRPVGSVVGYHLTYYF